MNPSDAEFPAAPETSSDQRRHIRSTVIWPGVIASPDGDMACTVLNLSAGGARVKILDDMAASEQAVRLKIAGVGQFPGRVVWLYGAGAGLEFALAPEVAAFAISQALRNGRALA